MGRRYVIEVDDRVILVRGYRAGEILRDAGMKPLWSHIGRGWVLDRDRLPDVALCIELHGGTYREVERGAA